MTSNEFINPSHYRDMIRQIEAEEQIPAGFDLVPMNAKGKAALGLMARLGGVKTRTVVKRDFHSTIVDATSKLKGRLEGRLFRTREQVAFNIEMRVRRGSHSSEAVALAHWSDGKGPEEYFYSFFANELRILLEESAHKDKGGIDARIAKNRLDWEADLSNELSRKFLVEVELSFIVQKEVTADEKFSTADGEFVHVHFVDTIDKTFPLKVDLRLRRLQESDSKSPLSRDADQLRVTLFDLIKRSCEQSIPLSHYWYEPDRLEEKLRLDLDAHLAEYGHYVSNLVAVKPPEVGPLLKLVPLQSVKLDASVNWQDSHGYTLVFRAEANARISEKGAGLYDRNSQPDRARWFDEAIAAALKHELAGASILDLEPEDVERCNAAVKSHIDTRAAAIGLKLEVFFGSVYLPNQRWLKIQRVTVEPKTYATAHPNIRGDFSMNIEVRFQSRKALDAFFTAYRSGAARNTGLAGTPSEAALDEFITKSIREAAIEAAESVMNRIDASEYFTAFTRLSWDASIPGLGEPGIDEAGENRIRQKFISLLSNRFPWVILEDIQFHRLDRELEGLRTLVGQLQTVEFSFTIINRTLNAALDRTVRGYVAISGGDAKGVVMMLSNGFHRLSVDEFSKKVSARLANLSTAALSGGDQREADSLMRSLTAKGESWVGDLSDNLRERISRTLKNEFGLLTGDIELISEISKAEGDIRTANADKMMLPFEVFGKSRASLLEQLSQLLTTRQSITKTSPDAMMERDLLTKQIEKTQEELSRLASSANGTSDRDVIDHIHDAESELRRTLGLDDVPNSANARLLSGSATGTRTRAADVVDDDGGA